MEKYDLIVIGAGNGGLMTACRAAQMGLKTLVVERHNMPGGAATSFVRGRFEFDASLHEIPDFGQGVHRGELGRIFDELGINVEMLPIKDAFRYVVEKHGKDAIMKLISEICPDDVEPWKGSLTPMKTCTGDLTILVPSEDRSIRKY